MLPLPSNALAAALALLVAFGMGWKASGWRHDSIEYGASIAAKAVADSKASEQAGISKGLEEQLARLSTNKTVIQREKQTIIERPVYSNVCLDADGLRLINGAKNGTLPAKPAGGVP